ncbi:MAG TPA: MBL fold metallo-hydrolase [Chitinophagaceae bacterium]|nr:MBL fold metallo-hydrolase [Chitinophagaceae bacterium]
MKIIPLSEGTFTVDKTKLFVPFDWSEDELQERSSGSLLVEIQPFVVITSNDILLLDTGLGFLDKNGKMQIHQNLLNAGIGPSDITKVLMTHLHKDHAGGISEKTDQRQLSFPNATYYVQHRELDFAFEKGFPSYITDGLKALQNNSQVVLLNGDSGIISDSIQYEVTGAHSPFHEVFYIHDQGQIAFFGGDDAPQLQQMKHRFVAKYDFNGKKAMELRRNWWQKGEKEKWAFLFYHDVKNPVWQF